jgi:hypothetical protein
MAILNGVEGSAHVELEGDSWFWKGYILINPDFNVFRMFQAQYMQSGIVYEGFVLSASGEAYLFGHGQVQITGVHYNPQQVKVEFRGVERFTATKTLNQKPEDYLS